MLQWGRRLASTESSYIAASDCPDFSLQWGRRLASTERSRTPTAAPPGRCFNGAVDWHRRKGAAREVLAPVGVVLQWGRRLASTERLWIRVVTVGVSWLQWGRRLASTESVSDPVLSDLDELASMGPSIGIDGK